MPRWTSHSPRPSRASGGPHDRQFRSHTLPGLVLAVAITTLEDEIDARRGDEQATSRRLRRDDLHRDVLADVQ